MTSISFDSNSLQTATILTESIGHENIPEKDAQLYALAHSNGGVIPYVNYPSRAINISGKIISTTIAGLDSALDTFRSYFNGTDKNLDIGYGGGTRRYIATANSTKIDRPGGLVYATFEIEFICTNPFGIETSATTALSASGRTSSNYNDNYTFLGTAPYQLPTVTLTMTTIPDADSRQIVWGNGGNGQVISIQRIFTSGDVVVINCETKEVTVNGTAVAFTGAFPEFPIGAQVIQYTDSFTSRTFTEVVTYTKRYL